MIGKTEIRPGQLTLISTPRLSACWARTSITISRATSSASAQRGSSSKCQQTIGAGEDREAVDQRVEQGAEAAVLAGDPGEQPVDVVAAGDQAEDDRGAGAAAVPRFEREVEEERDRGDPQVADQVRQGPGVKRLALLGLARRRAAAVEAEEPP